MPAQVVAVDDRLPGRGAQVRQDCGIELLSVMVTGDALTDGYLLSQAIAPGGTSGTTPDGWDPTVPAVFASRLASVG